MIDDIEQNYSKLLREINYIKNDIINIKKISQDLLIDLKKSLLIDGEILKKEQFYTFLECLEETEKDINNNLIVSVNEKIT